jgi:hypothetical protein
MTEHTFGHDSGHDLGWVDSTRMDTDIRQEIANEMRALAAAMFGLRYQEEVVVAEEPPLAATLGLGDTDVLGANLPDFDFDQDLGRTRDDEPEDADEDDTLEPTVVEPSRWATHDEPTIHNARTRAMLDELAFLDE